MKRPIFYILVGLVLTSVLFTSCEEKKHKGGRTDTPTSGVMAFASDESFSPIIEEEREMFQDMYPEAKLKPIYTNEYEEVDMLMRGKIFLAITSRDFTPKQLKYLQDNNFQPTAIKLAYDALALIVNKNNNDTCISVKDVKRILSGEVTDWSQIYPGSRRGKIKIVFDNPKSSTVKFCEDSILGGHGISNVNASAVKTSQGVIDFVEKTPNAIGVIGSNWLNDKRDTTNCTFKKNIHVMSVSKMDKATEMNSWKPYQAYIFNGRYPFIRTIYALINDPINGLPWSFAHFIQGPKGQLIIFRSSLLPYSADVQMREIEVKTE